MAAHRYWRANAFEAYGGADIELSEFHLLAAGARVDTGATLTSNFAPDVSGMLANLQDDTLSTSARWSKKYSSALSLQWDFGGSPVDVDAIQLAGDSEWRFPLIVNLDWSNDGLSWTNFNVQAGITWPGKRVKTITKPPGDSNYASVTCLLRFEGPNNSTVFKDEKDLNWITAGDAKIQTSVFKFGGASAYFDGAGDYAKATASNLIGTGDLTVEAWVRITSFSDDGEIVCIYDGVDDATFTTYNLVFEVKTTGALRGSIQTGFGGGVNLDITTATGLLTINTWHHVALVADGTTGRIFIDGVQRQTGAISGTRNNQHSIIQIGRLSSSVVTRYFAGYMGGLRVTKGLARYKSAFSSLTAQFGGAPGLGITANRVVGRVEFDGSVCINPGPTISYGAVVIENPAHFGIESGSIKDQLTGVLGAGKGKVTGTVAVVGSPNQPVHRRVRLVRDRDGMVIREMWSDPGTGAYDFQYVDEAQTFTVITYDHLHNYRAVIADNITPELMP